MVPSTDTPHTPVLTVACADLLLVVRYRQLLRPRRHWQHRLLSAYGDGEAGSGSGPVPWVEAKMGVDACVSANVLVDLVLRFPPQDPTWVVR